MIENNQNGNFEELLKDFKTKYYIEKCKEPLEEEKKKKQIVFMKEQNKNMLSHPYLFICFYFYFHFPF